MKNILFVCKHNAFRSKIAEAYFKKLNKDNNYKIKSAGIIKSNKLNPIEQKIGKSLGIIINTPPRSLTLNNLFWADIIIVVADDVPQSIFNSMKKRGKKLIIWKIQDIKNNNEAQMRKIIISIREKIKGLIKNLK